MYLSLCFADTSITEDLIVGIPNTLFNLILGIAVYSSRDNPSP
jgi:hypothetical protein